MNGTKLFGLFCYGFMLMVTYFLTTIVYTDFHVHGAINWPVSVATLFLVVCCWWWIGGQTSRRILVMIGSVATMVELLSVNEGLSIGLLQPWLVVTLPVTIVVTTILLWHTVDEPTVARRRRTYLGAFRLD